MKKYISVLIAMLICAMLFGCADKTQDPVKTDENTPAGIVTDAPAQSTGAPDNTTAGAVLTDAPGTTEIQFDDSINVAIGDVGYKTLSEACKNVKDGETVKILKDFAENITLSSMDVLPCEIDLKSGTASCTIDGMNHTVTANVEYDSFIAVKSGKIDFMNLNIVYTETTKASGNYEMNAIEVVGAEAVFENCNIEAKWGNILSATDSKITVKFGNFTISEDNTSADSNIFSLKNSSLTVEGGTFVRDGIGINRSLIRLNGKSDSVTVNGGKFRSSVGRLVYLNCAGNAPGTEKARTFTVNGGEFEFGTEDGAQAPQKYDSVFNINNKGLTVNINGGSFRAKKGPSMFLLPASDCVVNIAGGTFTVKTDEEISAIKALMSTDSKATVSK